jgi:hypothetical protein
LDLTGIEITVPREIENGEAVFSGVPQGNVIVIGVTEIVSETEDDQIWIATSTNRLHIGPVSLLGTEE